MRRQLTVREWLLLALLGVILMISGYITLFYMPMTSERDRCISEAENCRLQTEALQIRLEDKHRMEQELKEIFDADPDPRSIAPYDNLKPVMHELNGTLSTARDYSLNFGTVDASQPVVRRQISMNFNVDSYAAAKEILQKLHDSEYRCMLDNVSLNLGYRSEDDNGPVFWWQEWDGDGAGDGGVSVSGTIVYFEYQKTNQTVIVPDQIEEE